MNLRQRYRGSIYRRILKLLISYSFLFIILFYANTFARYSTIQEVSPIAEVAKWEVEVTADGVANNTTIVLVPDVASSANGKIYPGATGYFDVVINPNDTEVSINYIISFSNLPDGISLTTYEFLDDDNTDNTQHIIYNNEINDYIDLTNREALSSLDSKTIRIHWKFDHILIDIDNLSGDEGLTYSLSMSVIAQQSFLVNKDINIKYVFSEGQMFFDGNTCLNTSIGLFSNENINRDFELTFDIDKTAYNSKKGAYLSCMDHTQTAVTAQFWPGFIFRTPNTNNSSNIDFIRRSNPSNTETLTISNTELHNIKLVRTGSTLYYDFNNTGTLELALDYSDIVYNFDSPLKFGSDFAVDMTPNSFSKGKISNITLQTIYNHSERPTLPTPTRTDYIFAGWYSDSNFTNKFGDGGDTIILPDEDIVLYAKWIIGDANGFTSNSYSYGSYIDSKGNSVSSTPLRTHFYPFIEENMHKNFEIYFEVANMDNMSNKKQLLFAESNMLLIKGTSATNYNISSSNNQSYNATISSNDAIRIVRINDRIYYSINGSEFALLWNAENSTNYSAHPVVIGGTMDEYGKLSGYSHPSYTCTFNNVRLIYLSDDATLQDFE